MSEFSNNTGSIIGIAIIVLFALLFGFLLNYIIRRLNR